MVKARRIRSNTQIENLNSLLAAQYGVPEGSVALVLPSGRKCRRDTTLAHLRRKWAHIEPEQAPAARTAQRQYRGNGSVQSLAKHIAGSCAVPGLSVSIVNRYGNPYPETATVGAVRQDWVDKRVKAD